MARRRLTTALPFAALAAYTVARAALRFPFADDFDLAVGKWPPGAAWLWAQHNEHRLPLVKFALALCARHGDFRVAVWLSWAIVTATCAFIAARVERAGVALLIAALLLNPESNAWRWDAELQSVACVALVLVALEARTAIVFAMASLLLPLTGGAGLLWSGATIAVAIRRARSHWIYAAGAIATVAVDLAWLHGWTRPPAHAAYVAAGASEWLRIAAQLAVAPLGSVAERAPLAIAIVVVPALALVVVTARRARLALFFAAGVALVLATAAARAGRGWIPGLEAHYALLVAPIYVVALIAADPRWPRASLAAGTLALVACVLAVPTSTRESRLRERAFIAECGTLPAATLAARHLPLFWDADSPRARAAVGDWMAQLDCDALRR